MDNSLDQQIADYAAGSAATELAASMSDGTVLDADPETVFGMMKTVSVGSQFSKMGTPGEIVEDLASAYFDQYFRAVTLSGNHKTYDRNREFNDSRSESMFNHSCMSRDDISRTVFDADNGDPSPLLRMKENYYFS